MINNPFVQLPLPELDMWAPISEIRPGARQQLSPRPRRRRLSKADREALLLQIQSDLVQIHSELERVTADYLVSHIQSLSP